MTLTAEETRRRLTAQSDGICDYTSFDLQLERVAPAFPVRVWKATAITPDGTCDVWVSASEDLQKSHSAAGAEPICPCCPQFATPADVADFHLGFSFMAAGLYDPTPTHYPTTSDPDLDAQMLAWATATFAGAGAQVLGCRYLGEWYTFHAWYVELRTFCSRGLGAWAFLHPEPTFVRAATCPQAMMARALHTRSPTPDGAALLHLGRALAFPHPTAI